MTAQKTTGNTLISALWSLTKDGCSGNEIREGKAVITATRNGLEKDFPVIPFEETFFDRYAKEIKNRDILPADLPDIREAYEDLRILLEN